MKNSISFAVLLLAVFFLPPYSLAQRIQFKSQELSTELRVGYAVRALDFNGDEKLDIAIVDSKRVLWLENPTWKEHVIYSTPDAKFDNVCFAPHDVNGDGKLDLALGADWQIATRIPGDDRLARANRKWAMDLSCDCL